MCDRVNLSDTYFLVTEQTNYILHFYGFRRRETSISKIILPYILKCLHWFGKINPPCKAHQILSSMLNTYLLVTEKTNYILHFCGFRRPETSISKIILPNILIVSTSLEK